MNQPQSDDVQKPGRGSKKWAGLLILLLIAAIFGFLLLFAGPKEPAYFGKPLSYWLVYHEGGPVDQEDRHDPTREECSNAVCHIGTNAIPVLLEILRAKDSALKMKLEALVQKQDFINIPFHSVEDKKDLAESGFLLLGDLTTNAIPALIELHRHPPSDHSKEIADEILMRLYPAPGVANPYWVSNDERAQWFVEVGLQKLQSESPSNAILAFTEAIKLEPTNLWAFINRAACKIDLKDYSSAILDCDAALKLDPTNHNAYFFRASGKYDLKDYQGADADFTSAINLQTNDIQSLDYRGLARANLGKMDEALADFNCSIRLSFSNDAAAYCDRALVEGKLKEYELGLADASKSVELNDRDPAAYFARGRMEAAVKDYKAAVADFDKAIKMSPADPQLYASRAGARLYLHDFQGVEEDVATGLQLDPKNVTAILVRGVMRAKRGGEDDAAIADLKRAAGLAPQVAELHGMLGIIQYKIADWPSALTNCRKALELGGGANISDFSSYIWLIRAQSGEEPAANKELSEFLKSLKGPNTNEWSAITARFFIGSVSETNLIGLATSAAKRPSAIKGQVCEALYYAGMKRKLGGDATGARSLFQKCLETQDDLNVAYLNAAVELGQTNRESR